MSKYHNRKTEIDGMTFDSIAEGKRYHDLKLLQSAGEISDLIVHPRYVIIDAFAWEGKKVRPTHYEGDFQYFDSDGTQVCEDVKGFVTKEYALKKKLFLSRYPYIRFIEVKA